MKWWHGVVWLLGALVVAAVLFPVFAKAKTGRGGAYRQVAEAIQVSMLVRRQNPQTAAEVQPYLASWRRPIQFTIRPQSIEGDEPRYEISVNGRTQTWLIPPIRRPDPRPIIAGR